MKSESGKSFFSPKRYEKDIIFVKGINKVPRKKVLYPFQFFRQTAVLLFFILITTLKINAQELKKTAVFPANTAKITLHIKGLQDEQACRKLENVFKECGKKILNYSIDKKNNSAEVIISEKLQPVDLLEMLEMQGIHAGWMNEKNEYVALDEEGELAEPINITK